MIELTADGPTSGAGGAKRSGGTHPGDRILPVQCPLLCQSMGVPVRGELFPQLPQACELQPSEQSLATRLQHLLARLLPAQADALRSGGAAGLVAQLAQEAEDRLPEIMRPRPKVGTKGGVECRSWRSGACIKASSVYLACFYAVLTSPKPSPPCPSD